MHGAQPQPLLERNFTGFLGVQVPHKGTLGTGLYYGESAP